MVLVVSSSSLTRRRFVGGSSVYGGVGRELWTVDCFFNSGGLNGLNIAFVPGELLRLLQFLDLDLGIDLG